MLRSPRRALFGALLLACAACGDDPPGNRGQPDAVVPVEVAPEVPPEPPAVEPALDVSAEPDAADASADGDEPDALPPDALPVDLDLPDTAEVAVEAGPPDAPVFPAEEGLVAFSRPGGLFTAPFPLALATPSAAVTLHVTIDGSAPSETSPVYQTPLTIDHPMTVRVLAVAGTVRETEAQVYLPITEDAAAFQSNLPLVFLHSLTDAEPPIDKFTNTAGVMVVAKPAAGVTRPLGTLDLATRVGWKVRGRSSRLGQQKSFAVELWNEADKDADRPLLGMPAQSDWVLYGSSGTDRSLIRNALIYALSNRVGRWAPRTRFVEVFVESGGRGFSKDSYRGVYTLIEKIKRDPQRVAITPLRPTDLLPPAITGGYIFKIDENFAPDEMPFEAAGQKMELVDPDTDEITPEQKAYLGAYLTDLKDAGGGVNARTGIAYGDYLDVDSWIDFHILNVFAKNADSLRLSAYFHKDRGGKLKAGPLWDFDRSMGSNDGRVIPTDGWDVMDGTAVFTHGWWGPLFTDPAFEARYWTRFEELLANHLRSDILSNLVITMAGELSQPQGRHYARWPDYAPALGYLGETLRLTSWIDARLTWVRANLRKR